MIQGLMLLITAVGLCVLIIGLNRTSEAIKTSEPYKYMYMVFIGTVLTFGLAVFYYIVPKMLQNS